MKKNLLSPYLILGKFSLFFSQLQSNQTVEFLKPKIFTMPFAEVVNACACIEFNDDAMMEIN